ncbi:MAG: YebC/PmpR family DNA-binding transcriptional regulator [Gammaproteobacteria bacterium]|nr:YebC/PmpR family DNA-binding transcriptional regulator [Gammaproteobacteria bacterium]
MAGHSKWANIQHRKGAQDAKRGKLFTKLIREITVAARMGGGDSSANPRLRAAIDKALAGNMTRDTIDRAVKRGSGALDGDNYEEVRYEGYGPGGIAILVDCLTDNRNRTVAEVRHAFTKYGGNLGTAGSVAYLFSKTGVINFAPGVDEDQIMDVSLDKGAEDVLSHDDGSIDVITTPEEYLTVKEALDAAGLKYDQAELTFHASTTAELDLDGAQKMLRMLEVLEDLDDVQNVYSNADISNEILSQFA